MPSRCISTIVFFILDATMVVGASVGYLRASRACAQHQPNFDGFLSDYGKSYEQEQYGARLSLYEKNARFVSEHNCQASRRWTATINKFSDWSPQELAMTFGELGVARESPHRHEGTLVQEEVTAAKAVPDAMDWTHLNATKDVMDQGACGSCWAVGSAALLRAHAEIAQGKDPGRFSVQQLVSCVPNEHKCGGEGGCRGSTTELALKYVLSRGLMKETEFPYEVSDDKACPIGSTLSQVELDNMGSSLIESKGNSGGLAIGLKGFRIMEENKMSSLMEALQMGPAKVSIAVPDGFHYYSSGVMDGCPKDSVLTHASMVIGYGAEHGEDYWLMMNSWGKDWGDNGYFRFLRRSASFEESEGCGVDNNPLSGNGCKSGPNKSPSTIRVCGMCGLLNNIVIPIFQD